MKFHLFLCEPMFGSPHLSWRTWCTFVSVGLRDCRNFSLALETILSWPEHRFLSSSWSHIFSGKNAFVINTANASRVSNHHILSLEPFSLVGLCLLSTKKLWDILLCFSKDSFIHVSGKDWFSLAIATDWYVNQLKIHPNLSRTVIYQYTNSETQPIHDISTLLKAR